MQIKFWGVRGSVAVPGKDTNTYGGNTSCVEIRTENNDIIILDMGTGIRVLGNSLMKEFHDKELEADILITHTHWDHIQGFPFFAPVLLPKYKFRIYGLNNVNHNLEEILQGQMRFEYFPIDLKQLNANITFHTVQIGRPFNIGKKNNIKINTELLIHPGGSIGYRIEGEKGETYVHICDCEHHKRIIDSRVVNLAKGADLMLHDSQYTPLEMKDGIKDGWGHSSWDTVLEVARLARVKRLVLFHHEPNHTDEFMKDLEEEVKGKTDIEVFVAREGQVIKI